jgi:hypothetical protein
MNYQKFAEKKFAYRIYNFDQPCCICFDNIISLQSPGYVNECGHWTCFKCYLNINRCPTCNANLNNVKAIGGSKITILELFDVSRKYKVDLNKTLVEDLKIMHANSSSLVADMLRFVYFGKAMADDKTLAHYKVEVHSKIHSVLALRGD